MRTRTPQIVAFGGGGFSMEAGNPLLDDYVLGLARRERPRVCFVPTASGDADHYIVRFYRAFSPAVCEPSHLSLFRRDRGAGTVEGDLEAHLLSQDVIYVGGGLGHQPARRMARARHRRDPAARVAQGDRALRPQRGFAVLVRRSRDRLPRARRSASTGSGCCRGRTACTTTASPSAAWSTTASSATACAAATPPTTARRCTSPATICTPSSPRGRGRRGYRVDVRGDEVVETPLEARYLGVDEPALSAA